MTTSNAIALRCSPMVMQEWENDNEQRVIIIITSHILSSGKDGWSFFFLVKFVIEIPSIIMVLKPLHAPPSFSMWECGRGIFFGSKFIGSTFRLCILLFLEFVSFYANFNTGIQLYPHLVFLFFYLFVQYLHLVFYYFFFMCNTLVLCYNFLSIYAIFSLFRE
jgi:hypothetical protein